MQEDQAGVAWEGRAREEGGEGAVTGLALFGAGPTVFSISVEMAVGRFAPACWATVCDACDGVGWMRSVVRCRSPGPWRFPAARSLERVGGHLLSSHHHHCLRHGSQLVRQLQRPPHLRLCDLLRTLDEPRRRALDARARETKAVRGEDFSGHRVRTIGHRCVPQVRRYHVGCSILRSETVVSSSCHAGAGRVGDARVSVSAAVCLRRYLPGTHTLAPRAVSALPEVVTWRGAHQKTRWV